MGLPLRGSVHGALRPRPDLIGWPRGSRQPWWRCRLAPTPLRASLGSVFCRNRVPPTLSRRQWTAWQRPFGRNSIAGEGNHVPNGRHRVHLVDRCPPAESNCSQMDVRPSLLVLQGLERAWMGPAHPSPAGHGWPEIGIPPTRTGVALRKPPSTGNDPRKPVRTGPPGPMDAAERPLSMPRSTRAAGSGSSAPDQDRSRRSRSPRSGCDPSCGSRRATGTPNRRPPAGTWAAGS